MSINIKDVSKAHLTNLSNESLTLKIDLRTMTTFRKHDLDAFDILFKNFFNNESFFSPVTDTKIGHPVDIYENGKGLHFEIAGTGLTKDDISISIESDVLKISYKKPELANKIDEEDVINYYHKGISKKSFNLGYRIPLNKFNLSSAHAEMNNGLLKISIPLAEEAKPKTLQIK